MSLSVACIDSNCWICLAKALWMFLVFLYIIKSLEFSGKSHFLFNFLCFQNISSKLRFFPNTCRIYKTKVFFTEISIFLILIKKIHLISIVFEIFVLQLHSIFQCISIQVRVSERFNMTRSTYIHFFFISHPKQSTNRKHTPQSIKWTNID